MKIKLSKEILEIAEREHALQYEIKQLSRASLNLSTEFWKAIKEKYKEYNLKLANINYDSGELILPFEDAEDDLE